MFFYVDDGLKGKSNDGNPSVVASNSFQQTPILSLAELLILNTNQLRN